MSDELEAVGFRSELGAVDRGKSGRFIFSELQVLLALIRHQGEVVRRGALESAAWGAFSDITPKALDVAIHRLRGKLVALKSKVSITNTKGVGYALAVSQDA